MFVVNCLAHDDIIHTLWVADKQFPGSVIAAARSSGEKLRQIKAEDLVNCYPHKTFPAAMGFFRELMGRYGFLAIDPDHFQGELWKAKHPA